MRQTNFVREKKNYTYQSSCATAFWFRHCWWAGIGNAQRFMVLGARVRECARAQFVVLVRKFFIERVAKKSLNDDGPVAYTNSCRTSSTRLYSLGIFFHFFPYSLTIFLVHTHFTVFSAKKKNGKNKIKKISDCYVICLNFTAFDSLFFFSHFFGFYLFVNVLCLNWNWERITDRTDTEPIENRLHSTDLCVACEIREYTFLVVVDILRWWKLGLPTEHIGAAATNRIFTLGLNFIFFLIFGNPCISTFWCVCQPHSQSIGLRAHLLLWIE